MLNDLGSRDLFLVFDKINNSFLKLNFLIKDLL